jgi:hypothetical protein
MLASLLATAAAAQTDDASLSLTEALRNGKPILSLRYRFENVSDDSRSAEAHASTLRTAFGYRTGAWRGWSLHLEAEDVSTVGNDLYNNAGFGDANNGVRDRPVVADPADTGLNQAFARYESGDLRVQAGRQEIVLGDSRFVGNVGWRQNHQSFDALRVSRSKLGRFDIDYAFIENASRINGGNHNMSSHSLQGALGLAGGHRLTLYGLLLDYEDLAQAALSSTTFGAELKGGSDRGTFKLLWEAEYAHQVDAGDNPGNIDSNYVHLMAGAQLPRVTVKLGYEVLSGSVNDGQFRTPLATLHKFNGWADKFLATPANGLEDLYLGLAGKVGAVGWTAFFHDFSSETGGSDYGQEVDLQLLYKAPWNQSFGLKGAFYDAESFSVDTTKWMLFTSYSI